MYVDLSRVSRLEGGPYVRVSTKMRLSWESSRFLLIPFSLRSSPSPLLSLPCSSAPLFSVRSLAPYASSQRIRLPFSLLGANPNPRFRSLFNRYVELHIFAGRIFVSTIFPKVLWHLTKFVCCGKVQESGGGGGVGGGSDEQKVSPANISVHV